MHQGARRGGWHTVAAASAITVATALAGCGGGANKIVLPKHPVSTTSTTDLPGDDPCKLLKRADVTDAFGMPFADGTPVAGTTAQCEFRAGTNSGRPGGARRDAPRPGRGHDRQLRDRQADGAGGVRDIDGVGDQAYYSAQTGRLWVRRGVFGFDVGATPALVPEPDGEQRLIPLARLVLERHP